VKLPKAELAPAKVNLFLHVGARRADGYHALQSLVVFAEVGDRLRFEPADRLSLAIEGPFADRLSPSDDNLVLKAARALDARRRITLSKNLPLASGIGGGSADAAAVLRYLGKGRDDLLDVASAIGSDIPVCVASKSSWMEGRGEILRPVAGVPALAMLLVNPGVAVGTAEVFRALETRRGTGLALPARFENEDALFAFLATTANDLEAPACNIQPVIGEVIAEIAAQRGVRLSRMSGSGATCFGLFDSDAACAGAADAIAASHPAWWVRATRIAQ